MKRFAAILIGALAMGLSSQAEASGDPLVIQSCYKSGCGDLVSVGQLTGPGIGDLVCSSGSQTMVPLIATPGGGSGAIAPTYYYAVICKQ